jgi:hypothetical protein
MKTVQRIFAVISIVISYAGITCAGTIDLPRTGQSVCTDATGKVITCAGTGQDGDKQAGNPWPVPRFTDNNNGTATDNLTGLVWLRNANCFGTKVWADAITVSAGLATAACGLTDGSKAGDWRLPNINELRSLVDYSQNTPALTAGHPFYSLQRLYWSSSNDSGNVINYAYLLDLAAGRPLHSDEWYGSNKSSAFNVWPVRSGL